MKEPFEKIWIEQCRATRAIKRRFGVKDALDYLVGEKLRTFAGAARNDTAFARELPRFLAAIGQVFNEYEVAGYVAMQKPRRWQVNGGATPIARTAESRRIRERGHARSRAVGVPPAGGRRRGRSHCASAALRSGVAAQELCFRIDSGQ